MHIVENHDPLFDTPTAAAYLGASEPTLQRWRKLQTGPAFIKMAGLVKYRRSDLDRYIDECTRSPRRRPAKAAA